MKIRELRDLQQKPKEELEAILKENRERLRSLQFEARAGKLKNVHELRFLRKKIAIILTALGNQP